MPEKIGKYILERMLGQGGFGKVYLAFDSDVGQPVAIKRLIAQGDPDLLTRFQLEIRTTASLRHKNIVTILASGEEAGDPYVVMEFLEGLTLKQIIQGSSRLSLLDKIRVMSQVAEGLAYAHSKGVVHRDVKPENLMLLPSDNLLTQTRCTWFDHGLELGTELAVDGSVNTFLAALAVVPTNDIFNVLGNSVCWKIGPNRSTETSCDGDSPYASTIWMRFEILISEYPEIHGWRLKTKSFSKPEYGN